MKKFNDQIPPEIESFLTELNKNPQPPQETLSVNERREGYLYIRSWAGESESVHKIEDVLIQTNGRDIKVRAYIPTKETVPILIYFHGGIFALGDLETHDIPLRSLANASNCIILAVDYRRAPEFKFPAPLEDAWEVLNWSAENGSSLGGDTTRIAVGGDSAGGNIATVLSRWSRDKKGPNIKLQVLIYPMLDALGSSKSFQDYDEGYFMTSKGLLSGYDYYLTESDDRKHEDISPFWSKDLSRLPPAFILTAQFDPLRDEGETYALKLRQAGTDAFNIRYSGMIHGFFQFGDIIPQGKTAITETASILRMFLY
ncbi:alpha/beta hydrolase [uncultured Aquimarina sp.]|uniref:alpha/beta hydrolase n=1 Tax=uncultured Aquimarina sp. TaxID=575652 RepID=UPI00260BA732|nr:alpha/beta hydrolase [uncultured Aquimarina sp.]